ncbi:MAG: MotA/TolQ/ExbB proton channel family protein [Spirochaetes bacterium]|nr:MotA/TolQ/ExbB proton channel family protein [Spirochaetota bacterium]
MNNIFQAGGILMIPLFLTSIFAFAIILERFVYYNKINDFKENNFLRLKSFILAKSYDQSIAYLKNFKSPISMISETLIKEKNLTNVDLELVAELENIKASNNIYKFLPILKVLPNLSTMLGLLGTVLGMIKNFAIVAQVGTGDPKALASGISEALITTATGLFIAIPIMLFYTILENKASNIEDNIQVYTSEILKFLKD